MCDLGNEWQPQTLYGMVWYTIFTTKSFNSSSKVDVEVGHINKFYSSTKAKSKVGQ